MGKNKLVSEGGSIWKMGDGETGGMRGGRRGW